MGDWDLILLGRQASDWNSGTMGVALGGLLNIPCITFAQKVDVQSDALLVNRVLDNGNETVQSKLPAVVMVTNELGELRYPAMKERREAKKKPIQAWSGSDVQLDAAAGGKLVLKKLYYPELKAVDCNIIDGDSSEQAGANLAKALFENNILPVG
ncbi:MAG: hypothetical protein JRI43_00260 [Deltaproteobacteria bacterium]|nr:hypothetical protein [Deltaproteobacteria bacterium]